MEYRDLYWAVGSVGWVLHGAACVVIIVAGIQILKENARWR
jgi:hypothetical protein